MRYRVKRFSRLGDKLQEFKTSLSEHERTSTEKEKSLEGSSDLYNKIKSRVQSDNIKFSTGGKSTKYTDSKAARSGIASILKDKSKVKELMEYYKVDRRSDLLKPMRSDANYIDAKTHKGVMRISNRHKGSPSVIAHELGHSMYKDNHPRLSSLSTKLALRKPSSGKVKSLLSSGASKVLKVIEEAGASRNGIKVMKSLGATKDQLKQARKSMLAALGTHILDKN